ncbi:DUF2844 domain-containing protein [Burkholderia glumae]|uniref:DUF2844 domain-containing protein n=1 Tax=Burkholderia glumae TaxID=337 RepID=A0AAP9XZU1_BURGL|nr:DUF2844 domain-containing protein [Burkholderia glumae]ACR27392.1 Hypothetical protein bglu_1g01910 [Burkholderia glumae BGR1]AJY67542.1 hypothetical protein KS03_1106 [Burkholderia glumae LMG 2196 = ATCC 33617]KHJ62399.1 hypothetical protein NCPPB3923_13705 [Burkholderia glumae]MCM2481649.1 DUF2844 domain-containing protein [Burkholderia glumae]MCM2491717.1 DUF2844 domain-containing protein [Burkholderia glumae]
MKSIQMRGLAAKWAVGLLAAGCAASAFAELGGAPTPPPAGDTAAVVRTLSPTVNASAQLAGSGTAARGAYTVRETKLGSGTVIREYLNASGTVFGLAWQGPTRPDLAALLGSYLPQYMSGVEASHAAHGLRAPITVDSGSLVVHAGGHMGAFVGQAWLPAALPAGVTGNDIQ